MRHQGGCDSPKLEVRRLLSHPREVDGGAAWLRPPEKLRLLRLTHVVHAIVEIPDSSGGGMIFSHRFFWASAMASEPTVEGFEAVMISN